MGRFEQCCCCEQMPQRQRRSGLSMVNLSEELAVRECRFNLKRVVTEVHYKLERLTKHVHWLWLMEGVTSWIWCFWWIQVVQRDHDQTERVSVSQLWYEWYSSTAVLLFPLLLPFFLHFHFSSLTWRFEHTEGSVALRWETQSQVCVGTERRTHWLNLF